MCQKKNSLEVLIVEEETWGTISDNVEEPNLHFSLRVTSTRFWSDLNRFNLLNQFNKLKDMLHIFQLEKLQLFKEEY